MTLGRPLRVLWIDDDQVFAAAASKLVGLIGHAITVVHDADAAFVHLYASSVDVVICDWDLGRPMNGAMVLDLVAARWPKTQRVLCSGQLRTASAAHAILHKPLLGDDVRRLLAKLADDLAAAEPAIRDVA